MSVQKVSCASCGAAIQVPADIDRLNCLYCGSTLVIQRGEGYIAAKLAEQLGAVIQNTSAETQSAIREGNQAIQAELKRLRLNQEITTAHQQLSSIREEIQARRAIKGNRQNYLRLVELQKTEAELLDDIAELEDELSPPDPQPESELEPEIRRGSSPAYNLPAIVVILLGLGCLCYLMFGLGANSPAATSQPSTTTVTVSTVGVRAELGPVSSGESPVTESAAPPTSTSTPSPTATQPPLIIDVTRIIGAPRQEIQQSLGGSLNITYMEPGDLESLPFGGTVRDYRAGSYIVAVSFDPDDVAASVQVMDGLLEDGYELADWPILLARMGLNIREQPDRAAVAGMHWDNFDSYAISLFKNSPDGKVWTVLVMRKP